jgi:hypothetical protein
MTNHSNIQCTNQLMMVRPKNFGFNPETADSNAFQTNDRSLSPAEIKQKAVEEFDLMVYQLEAKGISIHVIEDSDEPVTPDAVFPNNWITFHEDGSIITYPMQALARRKERRDDIIYRLADTFKIEQRYYLEFAEEVGLFLEGTGSLIFDRVHKLAYACISPRTDKDLLERFCAITGYRPIVFEAVDQHGQQIYHTNVMMAMGDHFVVICLDSVHIPEERAMLETLFQKTGKDIIDLTMDQMNAFAGNMLQVSNDRGQTFLIMSEQAYNVLRADQVDQIKQYTQILHSPIYTIEKYGGGSARCMMAEIFLPLK